MALPTASAATKLSIIVSSLTMSRKHLNGLHASRKRTGCLLADLGLITIYIVISNRRERHGEGKRDDVDVNIVSLASLGKTFRRGISLHLLEMESLQ